MFNELPSSEQKGLLDFLVEGGVRRIIFHYFDMRLV